MECTQVLLSESFDANNAVSEKIPVATLLIEGEYHTIYNTENVIGRENSCDIVISNSAISSKHAVIEAEDFDAHLIYDLGSTNKTRLGKMVMKPHVRYHINDGDNVTFGNVSGQYNISRKYLSTPVKDNTTLNSTSIPETPERLVRTLEYATSMVDKQKVESSVLELSDTDLFGDKEDDTNLFTKEIPSSLSKTSNDIYELDTLSFDENIENHGKQIAPMEDLNKIDVVDDIGQQEVVRDEKQTSEGKKDKEKNNFVWEDFPEIASPVGLDSTSPDNLDCPKSKISSSFLDVTNDELKTNQNIPKHVGGVILSDLCKSAGVDSITSDLNKQGASTTSKEIELETIGKIEKELCSGEDDGYIPMSQNIDMFEESPEKTLVERTEQDDVYEMLTQVSIDNKDVNNSIYDIQTQLVIPDNNPEPKIDKEDEPSFISPQDKNLFSILEPASQPFESNDKEERNDTSCLKVDETDDNCSFSTSIYEAATQPCLGNVKETTASNLNQLEIVNPVVGKTVQNESAMSLSLVEVATQPCPQGSVEKESALAEASNETDENESLSTTIVEAATQLCPVEASVDGSKQSHSLKGVEDVNDAKIKTSSLSSSLLEVATQPCPKDKPQILLEKVESNSSEKMSADDISMSDWYEIATQPCRTTLENVAEEREQVVEEEQGKVEEEVTKEVDEVFENKEIQSSSFSISMYEIATQPCPKDIVSGKTESINETTLTSELAIDESGKNYSFSVSTSELATQPCPKVILPEKTVSSPDLTITDEENYKNSSFSTSICEIATQPIPKDTFSKTDESINNTKPNPGLTTNDYNNSFSDFISEIATQPCPKDIFPEKNESINETILSSEMTIMNDESNKNSSFSASICEIATQPCPLNSKNTDLHKSIKNISSLDVHVEEKQPLQGENEIELGIEPKADNVLPSEIMYEIDTQPLHLAETKPSILNESVEDVVQESSKDVMEEESNNLLSVDKAKEVMSCDHAVELEVPLLDVTVPNSSLEEATQPPPCQADLNLPAKDENTIIPKVSEMSYEVETILLDVKSDVNLEKANNIEVSHKPSNISLTATTPPEALSASFFEAATQPYKNNGGEDRTFQDPLTSICNNLSEDKIGEISDEFMYGNISAKLEDKNTSLLNNNPNKECSELRNNLETSDSHIFEALNQQVPFHSPKEIPKDKVKSENLTEKMSTQDLQRILESDDVTHKYDEFNKTVTKSTSSDHTLNCELDLLKNNVNSMKDKIQNSENSNISNIEQVTDEMKNKIQIFISDRKTKSSLVEDVRHFTQEILDGGSRDFKNVPTKKIFSESVPNSQVLANKIMFIDSDSSQELNFRSNKKRCNVFPSDSQNFTDKFLENEDSSQEVNFKSNKKRCNVFPPDTQNFTDKFLANEDSSQEINFKSNKKRCNVFPPDSESLMNKFSENDDSSQELNIKSNKKRFNIFPPDSQEFTYKSAETVSNVSEEVSNKKEEKKSDVSDEARNVDQRPEDEDVNSKIVSNTLVENDDQRDIICESKSSNDKLDTATDNQTKVPKGKLSERISTPVKRNSKESKNKTPPERERESTYISRGNITLHSPEVLSELEEQFRLTKVAMSPTQLSVVSDIDDEIQSSQEVNELDKEGVRKSIRNRKIALSKTNSKNIRSPVSSALVDPRPVTSNENKRKETNSSSGISKNEKSFKKFKKVSPIKSNSPKNEELVKVATNEAPAEILSNISDNSQNSEELGRGKRKRTRPSYEGFIIEEEKKRTTRKKLFSNSEGSENMNDSTEKIEEINNSALEELSKDVSDSSMKKTASVVLKDTQKDSNEFIEPSVKKNKTFAKKSDSLSKKNKISTDDKISKPSSSSIKDEAKTKKAETSFKDNSSSFSFSEKLDELFNIWGPADRVKLSPRVAKKSYKLLAEGKTEPASPSANVKKSNTLNTSDKEAKPSTSKSNKKSEANEKKNEPASVVETTTVSASRKRNLSQKNEPASVVETTTVSASRKRNLSQKNEPASVVETTTVSASRKRNLSQNSEAAEPSEPLSKQNKKRRKTNSENSETSSEPGTNDPDPEVRKSTRITRKKTLEIPASDKKNQEDNSEKTKRNSNDKPKRTSNQSTESIEDCASVSNNGIKANLRNSNNTSMKPPLNTVVVNVRNKNLKTKAKKNPNLTKESHPLEMNEENYCFSQEYSFHEKNLENEKKKSSESCSNPPVTIRRSGRKKNEKTAEKNVENVMFTGFTDKKTKSLVNVLGGQIVESPFTCTVLVTDKIRRTTKFLSALSRGLPIVSPQWLIESNENGKFLDASDFLLSDNEAETTFSFNLKKSIEKAQNGKVLDGWAIFVTSSVKPSPEEMKSIIECSGGRFLSRELTRWPTNSIIVSCDEDRAMWSRFSKKGKAPILVDNEAILLGVLRQELDLESHKLT